MYVHIRISEAHIRSVCTTRIEGAQDVQGVSYK